MDKDLEYYLAQARKIAEHRTEEAEKGIRKTYKNLLTNLRHFLSDEYAEMAENDELTYGILQQKGEYARFLSETEKIINAGTPEASKQVKSLVHDVYKLCYQGMVDAVTKSSGAKELAENLKGLKGVTPEVIKRAVENPLSGLTLSDTLEKNRKEVIYDIKREIGVGLANGDRYSTMAKRVSERLDMDYRKSVTIVRTESHRVQEAGFHDSAKEINGTLEQGVTAKRLHKTWCSMKDERVRKTSKANHRKMNGVSIPVEEEFDLGHGVKAEAPAQSGDAHNDINCRCFLKYELKDTAEATKSNKAEEQAGVKASENKPAQGKDILTTWRRREDKFDHEIEDVINAQGFDGIPRVVSANEFEEAVKESNFIAQRAYSAPTKEILEEYREQMYRGKWYVDCSTGGSAYGQGMYAVYERGKEVTDYMTKEMNAYARGGEVAYIETFTLTKDAKVITTSELNKKRQELRAQASEFLAKNGWTQENVRIADTMSQQTNDGVFAAKLGYDAIIVDNGIDKYAVILNRTKVIFKGE